jgi:spore coat protein H
MNRLLVTMTTLAVSCLLSLAGCNETSPTPSSDACDSGDNTCAPLTDAGETPEVGQYPIHKVEITLVPSELEALTAETTEEMTLQVELTLNGQTFSNVDFELHGGFAKGVAKKSFRLELPDDIDIYPNLFGDGPEKQRRFVLLAAWIDPSFLRHKLTMDLIRESGGLSPRVSYAQLSFNEEHYGFFLLVERIDKLYLDRQNFRKTGNLYKAENHNANWQYKSNPLKGYDHQEGEENSTDDLGILLDALSNTNTSQTDFATQIEPLLQLEDFMIWQRVLTFAMEQDGYTKNYYLYHDVKALEGEEESRFRIVAWDTDATWGISWDGETVEGTESDWHGTDAFAPRLFSIDHYKDLYFTDYAAALNTTFSVETLHEKIDQWVAIIEDNVEEDLLLWDREFDFSDEIALLKSVIVQRHETMSTVIISE